MRRALIAVLAAAVALGCHHKKAPATTPVAAPLALSGLVTQRMVVLPTYTISLGTEVAWTPQLTRPRDMLRALDTDLLAALDERGLRRTWIFPEELVRQQRTNPTYATDPYALGEEPLRSAAITVGARLPEPLASQVRTLVAISDARYLLAPIEIRFAKAPGDSTGATGVPTLRLAVLDARMSEVRWVGEVRGDPATGPSPALTASLASRVVDLFMTP